MQIIKRSGDKAEYDRGKIKRAMQKAFVDGLGSACDEAVLEEMTRDVENDAVLRAGTPTVEAIQDTVEKVLMRHGFFDAAKAYILYREKRTVLRRQREKITVLFPDTPEVGRALSGIQRDFGSEACPLDMLCQKLISFQKEGMDEEELLRILIRAAAELTTKEAPKWEMAAARLLMIAFKRDMAKRLQNLQLHDFYGKIRYLTEEDLYGGYMLENYSREDVDACEQMLDETRNDLFTYSGLELMLKRYVIHDRRGGALETPQEMFMGVAMHLAMKEKKDRLLHVKKFYDILSKMQVTMATPTLSNARKPYHQLSSCFIDTVPDALDGIYRSVDNFARVSKLGGGMGLYFGKVRATGSAIRGFEGAAGGVIRWIRLVNDTAVAVDQLGMRQGAVAVYLDAWHKDLPEFLSLRTNNGDDRMKAHDVFPAVCYPDHFWQQAKDNLEGDWYLLCPHEVWRVKGYHLEDYFGDEWKKRYLDCVQDARLSKRVLPIKEVVRLVLKSLVETGTPFAFNRDIVNRANPNPHKGVIYCSNLCTEIVQNMSPIETGSQYIKEVDGETVVVSENKAGDFVVCNLASLSLGRLNVEDQGELQDVVSTVVRALDNVIDLNFYPLPYAKITNGRYRALGLGVSGYHHMLAKRGLRWESEEHLQFVDRVFEDINYYAVRASNALAKEKGIYPYFEGSDWQNGQYFEKRGYESPRWTALKREIAQTGMRNGYLLAVAPTSSTSILSGTTAGIDPIMNRFFLEEKKNGLMPRVAPELSPATFWLYKIAHQIDQTWSVRACGIRQRHIDQAQSMNLYITNDYTFRQVLALYVLAWEKGVKTVYYVRSKSLEVEECESCSS